ncbi:MAG: CYTH and CHAD domain-containing protein [Actinobacteria bacterium]|nr:CYTH and CHAD domain-containing protein [Actinomycetota bacterium]
MQAVTETHERELKLSVDPDFVLPELPGEELAERVFDSIYYDTADQRLTGAGATLRRRVENGRALWQLKLPRGESRLELELAGGPVAPEQIYELLTALVRGEELRPVSTLRTLRTGVRVQENEHPVAEVVIDRVSVLDGQTVEASFDEVEIELIDGSEADLERLERLLRRAGARGGDNRPKLFTALGIEPAAGTDTSRDGAALSGIGAIQRRPRAQYEEIVKHDPGTRLGSDLEDLHRFRVATRRLRALLRSAREALDPEWAKPLRDELAWLADSLGAVRDRDVLLADLRAEAAQHASPDPAAAEKLFALLEADREAARGRMLADLRSERYTALLAEIERGINALPVRWADYSPQNVIAEEFRKLRSQMRALGQDPDDEALHRTRISGKRARYAAELAEPTLGKSGTRFVKRAKAFQDLVGEHQDAVVAKERLLEAVTRLKDPGAAFVAGRLTERQTHRRQAAREALPKTWAKLEQSGLQLLR